ncbi:MAG: hypothetical protein LBD18_01175 [Treponema sp.]|jgi:hypothetical protein|nr:hypothetical protein [Treponema sp.]
MWTTRIQSSWKTVKSRAYRVYIRKAATERFAPGLSEETKNNICQTACHEKPQNASHWSIRCLAKKFKVNKTAVNSLLRKRGIKPHLVKTFKFSTNRYFQENPSMSPIYISIRRITR